MINLREFKGPGPREYGRRIWSDIFGGGLTPEVANRTMKWRILPCAGSYTLFVMGRKGMLGCFSINVRKSGYLITLFRDLDPRTLDAKLKANENPSHNPRDIKAIQKKELYFLRRVITKLENGEDIDFQKLMDRKEYDRWVFAQCQK